MKDINPREVTVKSGGTDSLQLEVAMTGGTVQWFKDGDRVTREPGRVQILDWDSLRQSEFNSLLSVKECKMEDAGTYTARVETMAGQCHSSPCVVTVVQGPPPLPKDQNITRMLRDCWIRANKAMCVYCHKLCSTPAATCEFCSALCNINEGMKVKINGETQWISNKMHLFVLCSDCKTVQEHCRFCRREHKWENKNLENINLDWELRKIAEFEAKLKEANAPSVWEYHGSMLYRLSDTMEREKQLAEKDCCHATGQVLG